MTRLELDVNQRCIMDLAACAIVENNADYTDEEVFAALSYLADRKKQILQASTMRRAALSGLKFTIPLTLGLIVWVGLIVWALIIWGIL